MLIDTIFLTGARAQRYGLIQKSRILWVNRQGTESAPPTTCAVRRIFSLDRVLTK